MRFIPVLVALLALAGCVTKEQARAEYDRRCTEDYGFERGTEGYSRCLMEGLKIYYFW